MLLSVAVSDNCMAMVFCEGELSWYWINFQDASGFLEKALMPYCQPPRHEWPVVLRHQKRIGWTSTLREFWGVWGYLPKEWEWGRLRMRAEPPFGQGKGL